MDIHALFDRIGISDVSIVDYVLIFSAVAFVLFIVVKVISVSSSFIKFWARRIKMGPERNKEVHIDDHAGDFERKDSVPELLTDADMKNHVIETSVRYQFLSDYLMNQDSDEKDIYLITKMKLPKRYNKVTEDWYRYILWNYLIKNKKIVRKKLEEHRLANSQPKTLLTEYDMPNFQNEHYVQQQNQMDYNDYRRVERQLCNALLKDIRKNEANAKFELVVKVAYFDVLGIQQIDSRIFEYSFVTDMLDTIPYVQELVVDLSHKYADILALNEKYANENMMDKKIYKAYRQEFSSIRPYRDKKIVQGITMPYRKFREIERNVCKDIVIPYYKS